MDVVYTNLTGVSLMSKIMIVEDLSIMQEILKEVLALNGHLVIFQANNGQEAIDYFLNEDNKRPDLVLMDHRMPGKDGITTMQEIFEIDDTTNIVFVSADPTARRKALAMGAVYYIIKPISVKTFLEVVEKFTQ